MSSPGLFPACLRSLHGGSQAIVLQVEERAPPLNYRWAGLILFPDPAVQSPFCSPAQVPSRNKRSPRVNAGCVLQAPLLEAGPELHYVALPADTDQGKLPRLDDGGMLTLLCPGISVPCFTAPSTLCSTQSASSGPPLSVPGTPVSPTYLQHLQSLSVP